MYQKNGEVAETLDAGITIDRKDVLDMAFEAENRFSRGLEDTPLLCVDTDSAWGEKILEIVNELIVSKELEKVSILAGDNGVCAVQVTGYALTDLGHAEQSLLSAE